MSTRLANRLARVLTGRSQGAGAACRRASTSQSPVQPQPARRIRSHELENGPGSDVRKVQASKDGQWRLYRTQESYGSLDDRKHGRTRHRDPDSTQTASTASQPQAAGPGNRTTLADSQLISIRLGEEVYNFSPLLLRDMCECPRCVDPSTRQKLFSTVETPPDIRGSVEYEHPWESVRIRWSNDLPAMQEKHVSSYSQETLRRLATSGTAVPRLKPPRTVLWTEKEFRASVQDVDYEAYMQDDYVLHHALQTLRTHGLLFLTNIPEASSSVSTIAERIGPVKNTFYGYTWDVRSVPRAKNVAYTAQNLGFHMDLLYMHQPPHLQFLHCIRSSSAGGASLFTDSYRAAKDLLMDDPQAFNTLSNQKVNFHYNHPESHYYRQGRKVFELKSMNALGFTGAVASMLKDLRHSLTEDEASAFDFADLLHAVSWSPPFQAPFSAAKSPSLHGLNSSLVRWHAAARKFNGLIHKPDGVYERMMKPGECVLFDNRRVLHARKAFEVGDVGKERWLRGAYLDQDPYMSKMRVLQGLFGSVDENEVGAKEDADDPFEKMAVGP